MTIHLDLNGLFATAVGAEGLAADDLARLEPTLTRVRDALATRRTAGELAFAELPYRRDDVRSVQDAAKALTTDFDTLVVLGIGGSALGARAVVTALGGDAWPSIGMCFAVSAAYLAIGGICLHYFERVARRTGSLKLT